MNEAELETLAINELLRESQAHNTQPVEPKQNKLMKTNKKFLNRTINSVISHNKREHERTQKNCREKLQALEDRRRKRLHREAEGRKFVKHSASSNETQSDTTDSDSELIIPMATKSNSSQHKKRTKQNEKITKKSATKTAKSTKLRIKHEERVKSPATQFEEIEFQRLQYEREENYAKHFDQLAAYALASESYHQVGKWLCYQALLAGSYESYESFEPKVYDTYEALGLSGIEVLEPLESAEIFSDDNVISLSSDDEVKEELDLDTFLQNEENNCAPFETVEIENCISLDSDTDEDELSECKDIPAVAIECELKDEEDVTNEDNAHNNNDDDDDGNKDNDGAMQTIELSDSSDGEEIKPTIITNGSIDLTSD